MHPRSMPGAFGESPSEVGFAIMGERPHLYAVSALEVIPVAHFNSLVYPNSDSDAALASGFENPETL